MDPNYTDDQNKPLYPLPQPTPQSNTGGFMNWMRTHKFATLVAVLILVALIWYFCVRKKKNVNQITTDITVPATITTSTGASIPTQVSVRKTRLGAQMH